MNVRTLILAILNFCEASGYEIKKMSSEGRFSYFVDISFGSIYPTLARLEADAMVACRVEEQTGKPDRKIYSITDKGRAELVHGLSQPPQSDIFKSEFLLLSMNAHMVGADVLASAYSDRVANLEAEIEMLDGVLAECDNPAMRWVASYGKHIMDCDLRYLKAHKKEFIALASPPALTPQAAE